MRFMKLGATALAGVFLAAGAMAPAAFAQQPLATVSKAMAGAFTEANAAIAAKDWATARTKLNAAYAAAKLPTEKLAVEQTRVQIAANMQDWASLITHVAAIEALNIVPAADMKTYRGVVAESYKNLNDIPNYLKAQKAYLDQYGGTHDVLAVYANDLHKANDNAAAISYADQAIAAARTAGVKPPESYYRLKARALNATGDKAAYYKVIETVVAEYPNDDYWRELIVLRAKNEAAYDEATVRLDMYRMLAASGIKLSAQEKSNIGREAIRRGLPQEALNVLEPAIASGELGAAQEDKDNLATAKRRVGEDKPNLAKETADIVKEGNASAMAAIGEAHLSYGDNAKAIEVLQAALAKGIANAGEADLARLHLGIAQYRSGDKAAAQATWATIKANNGAAVFAQNWTLISKTK
jgi:hypothetical protein